SVSDRGASVSERQNWFRQVPGQDESIAPATHRADKSITKREAIIKLAVNKVLSGDIRCIRFLRELSPQAFHCVEESTYPSHDPNPPSDEEKVMWCLELVKVLDELGQLPAKAKALLQEFAARKC